MRHASHSHSAAIILTAPSPVFLRTFLSCMLALILTLCAARAAGAQDNGGEQGAATEKPAQEEKKTDEEETEKEKDRWFAVTGARVHTVSGPVIETATVLCKNGRIVEIGPRVTLPEGAETLDASGHELYPGLIAVRSAGLVGGGNPADSTDVFSLNMNLALAGGITSAVSGERVAKLTWGTTEDILVADNLFESLSYSTSSPNQRRQVRADLERVHEYRRSLQRYNIEKAYDPDLKEPDKEWIKGNYARYLRLMNGEAVAEVNANTASEILAFCEIANAYGIKFVVSGAYEGWTVAPEMARAGMSAIITPRIRVDPDEDLIRPNGSTIENARILHDHGVPVTFIPVGSLFGPGYQISLGGLAGRDLQHLPMEAAFAVRGGMSNDDAIRAITLDAARILGVSGRIGSIEIGKDADFVIADGDLLHYTTQPRWTIVNARIAYDKAKDTLFSHIRPGGDADALPPPDYWPRSLGAPWVQH